MASFYSPFPPNFTDGPLSYALALFGDLFALGLSLTILLHYLLETRRMLHAEQRAPRKGVTAVPGPTRGWLTLVRANDIIVMGFALMVAMRTLPDAIWMIVWGEASFDTMQALFLFDYVFDFLALIPLGAGAILWAFARQPIAQQLIKADGRPLSRPTLIKLSGVLRIGGLVALISVGLTVAKAASA